MALNPREVVLDQLKIQIRRFRRSIRSRIFKFGAAADI